MPAPHLWRIQCGRVAAPLLTHFATELTCNPPPPSRLPGAQVLRAELGPDWRSRMADFDYVPMAAASIGQVHGVVTHSGQRAAMKIQYPGVARSIESDVGE